MPVKWRGAAAGGSWYTDFIKESAGTRARIRVSTRVKINTPAGKKQAQEIENAMVYQGIQERFHGVKPPVYAEEVILHYLKNSAANLKSYNDIKSNTKRLLPHIKGLDLRKIKQSKLYEIGNAMRDKGERKQTLTGATINRTLNVLSAAISYWNKTQDDDLPVLNVKFKESPGRTRYLTTAEVNRLLRAATEAGNMDCHDAILLSVYTGARQMEILSLLWANVDLANGEIKLIETKNNTPRSVPLHTAALAVLKNRKQHATSKYVFPSKVDNEQHIKSMKRSFAHALKDAGIDDFRWHDMRHTAASYLAKAGVSPLMIAAILGHKSLSMVKRYAHLAPSGLSDEINKISFEDK